MDVDMLTRLEKLETKRRALNAQFDLTKECESIEELKRRISIVSDSISSIKNDVKIQSDQVNSSCDKLSNIYSALRQDSHLFELLSQLSQLNFLCKQIDHEKLSKNRESFQELVHNFELFYKPLEEKLSTRPDLPYVDYSKKLEKLKLEHSKAIDSESA